MDRTPLLFAVVVVLGLALGACGTSGEPSATVPAVLPATSVPEATPTGTALPAPTRSATLVGPTPTATSRGPELQASDPEAVRLEAGSLQLVEFFRFT